MEKIIEEYVALFVGGVCVRGCECAVTVATFCSNWGYHYNHSNNNTSYIELPSPYCSNTDKTDI